MNEANIEKRSVWGSLKSDIELYLFYRRYQNAMRGKLLWEEKITWAFTQLITKVAASWRNFVKRSVDVFCACVGLTVAAPVMALIAAAIKLDSKGPILFMQTRVGLKGRVFAMFKFRTMRDDAEAQTGPVWAQKNDPRVTRVGSFLRKTHLDDLPQLWNVVRGEMSLVGPRPERPYFVSEFRKIIPHYDRRVCVKPGITGFARLQRQNDATSS